MIAAVRFGIGVMIFWEQSGVKGQALPAAHSPYHADIRK
jgi:hypothetical protein